MSWNYDSAIAETAPIPKQMPMMIASKSGTPTQITGDVESPWRVRRFALVLIGRVLSAGGGVT